MKIQNFISSFLYKNMDITIPRGSIVQLDRFKSKINEQIDQEKNNIHNLNCKHLSRKIMKFLDDNIKDCNLITNSNTIFSYEIPGYGIEKCENFIFRFEKYLLAISIMFRRGITVKFEKEDNSIFLLFDKNNSIWQVHNYYKQHIGLYDPQILQVISIFIERFFQLNTESYNGSITKLYNSLNNNYKAYPIAYTYEAIICILSIKWFRESILSELPKDIVRAIGKILWNDRNNFFC